MMKSLIQKICNSAVGGGMADAAVLLDWNDHASYKHRVDVAEVVYISPLKWKPFLTTDVKLRDNNICNLRVKGLNHPKDLAACDADKVDAIFKNMLSSTTLRAHS